MSAPVTLNGRLAADPQLHFSKDGGALARFTVVTSLRKKDASGQYTDTDVTFWRCIAFGKVAENVCEFLGKGTAVLVTGRAIEDKWTDRDGTQRTSLCCVVSEVGENIRWKKNNGDDTALPRRHDDDVDPPF